MNRAILLTNLYAMSLNLVYAIVAVIIGMLIIKYVDRLIFPQIDFIAEIKRGNIASAIFAGMILIFLALVLSNAVR
jgi:hypothetical protein